MFLYFVFWTIRAKGCRLDSGDLSYLSQEVRRMVTEASKTFNRPFLAETNIIASDDINEESLHYLSDQVCHCLLVLFVVAVAVLNTFGQVDAIKQ